MSKTTNIQAGERRTELARQIITEILEEFPCAQCGMVEVLLDADVPGATCDCGRKEGCQTRWELADIWSQMSKQQQQHATEAEAAIERADSE